MLETTFQFGLNGYYNVKFEHSAEIKNDEKDDYYIANFICFFSKYLYTDDLKFANLVLNEMQELFKLEVTYDDEFVKNEMIYHLVPKFVSKILNEIPTKKMEALNKYNSGNFIPPVLYDERGTQIEGKIRKYIFRYSKPCKGHYGGILKMPLLDRKSVV